MLRSRRVLAVFSIALAALLAIPVEAAEEVAEIAACVRRNFPEQTSLQTIHFRSTDRIGAERRIEAKVWWKRFDDGYSRVLVRLAHPPDLRGAGLLMIEKKSRSDMFLYLPDLRKIRRVTSHMMSGSLFGSDFTYEDFEQLQGVRIDGRTEKLEDSSLEERPVHVLVQYPAPEAGSSYERVVSYVEKDSCVLLKTEMWEGGERLRKVLTANRDTMHEEDGLRIPRELLMRDLKNQTETLLVVKEIEVGSEIPNKGFSLTQLERPRVR
jgi:hypothetical protein